jgi:DNA repair protein RadC
VTTYTIKEWPTADQPRERLRMLGPRALASRELLALLIETGRPARKEGPPRPRWTLRATCSAGRRRAGAGHESLRRILTAPPGAICEVYGIGPRRRPRSWRRWSWGRRATEEVRGERDRIASPRDVYERMRLVMRDLPQEEFHVLLLNTQNQVLRDVVVTRGTLDASLVHPREVFRPALAESPLR